MAVFRGSINHGWSPMPPAESSHADAYPTHHDRPTSEVGDEGSTTSRKVPYVKHFRIILSRPHHSATFESGETVRGIVVFDVTGPQGIRLLRLNVRGTCATNLWDEDEEEMFFNWKTVLLGSEKESNLGIRVMPSHHHRLPFQFTLPESCPSSFDSENVSISYTIKAELYPNEGWRDHKDSSIQLSVISPLDIGSPKYAHPVAATSRTSVDCCAAPFKTTNLDIQSDKQGFHAGESISFTGTLINGSKDLLKSSITLCQELVFNQHDDESEAAEPYTMFKVIKTMPTDDLLPCSRLVWDGKEVTTPSRTPLSILNCRLFQLRYFAEVTLRNSDDHKILSVELPFTVGSTPPPPSRTPLRGSQLLRVNTNPAIATTSTASTASTSSSENIPGPSRARRFSRANTSPLLLPPRVASPGPPAYDDLSIRNRHEDEEESPPDYDECLTGSDVKVIPSAPPEVISSAPLDTAPSAPLEVLPSAPDSESVISFSVAY